MRHIGLHVILSFLMMVSTTFIARADGGYLLDEGDVLRLVMPTGNGMEGTYRLGEGGRIALPVGGQVLLGGLSIEDATTEVTSALSQSLKSPSLALEIIERRPFFISGDVAKPGAYPHMAGLTAGMAIAVAGGAPRLSTGDLQADVTGIRAEEEYESALVQLAAARLRAERAAAGLAGRDVFNAPAAPEGLDPALHREMADQERKITLESFQSHQSRMALLSEQTDAIHLQIAQMQERIEQADARVARIDRAIADRQALAGRGLVSAERMEAMDMQRSMAQGELLQTGVMLAQAREDLLNLQLQTDEAPRERRLGLLTLAAQAQSEILRLENTLRTSAALIDVSGGRRLSADGVTVSILRGGEEIGLAGLQQPVLPGDLLTVSRDRATVRGSN